MNNFAKTGGENGRGVRNEPGQWYFHAPKGTSCQE